MAHPHEDLVHQGYAAFAAGDLDAALPAEKRPLGGWCQTGCPDDDQNPPPHRIGGEAISTAGRREPAGVSTRLGPVLAADAKDTSHLGRARSQ